MSNASASSAKVHAVTSGTSATPPTSPESAHSTHSADAHTLSLPKTIAKHTTGSGRVGRDPLAGHSSSSVNLRSATLGSTVAKRGSPTGASAVAQLIASANPTVAASLVKGSAEQLKRHSGNGVDSASLHSLGDLEMLEARAKKLSRTSLTALGERDAERVPVDREEYDRLVVQVQQYRDFVKDFVTQFEQVKVRSTSYKLILSLHFTTTNYFCK